ncbi:MAG: hypothetical protein IKW28_01140 [Lachnospiraceae bacterium]|nr:hypothetical protein [Lachnospiraceae bacterium]
MSYCVECGVRLDRSLKVCPLCCTPVINPNEVAENCNSVISAPFAAHKGEVEPMSKRDVGMWLSIVLGSTALACGLLNLFVFQHNRWSIPVVGACILLWILFCPRMFFPKIPFSINLLGSGLSIIFYEYALTLLTKTDRWFFELCFPITLICLILFSILGILYHYISHSLLATALYLFIIVGIMCVFIEFNIHKFWGSPLKLSWSAIVFSVCAVISIALISIMSIKRLRIAVRKRLHF